MNPKLFYCFILSLFISFQLSAQCVNGTDSYPIYKQGESKVIELDNQGMEIVKIEYDLVLTSKITYRYLSPDWKYKIMAFADDGVKDLDIYLYEYDEVSEDWKVVAKDDGDGSDPFVFHIPDEYTEFAVEVVVNEFHEGYSAARYGLIYVHE